MKQLMKYNTTQDRLFITLSLLIIFGLILGGCAELGSVRLADETMIVPQRKAVILFADGIGNDVFEEMRAAGKLPNIDKYLVKRGCLVAQAVTAVPSITYAITATFATGRVPGHHGILGNMYFDRDQLRFIDYNSVPTYRNIDLDYSCPNIYEILSDHFSITIQSPLARGAYDRIDNWATSGACWFLGLYETVDRWTARRFRMVRDIARRAGRWPGLIFAYFPGTDEIGHRWGPDSEEYRASLANIDRQVGHICGSLQASGLLESTYLIFVSDHGMNSTPPENYLDIEKFLHDRFDMKVATSGPDQRKQYVDRVKYFRRHDAVLSNGSGRRMVLYLKNGSDWSKPVPVSRIRPIAEVFARLPGVCLGVYRDSAGVIVHGEEGRALIQRRASGAGALNEKQYRYRIIDGRDPLGYDSHLRSSSLTDGEFHDGQTWLAGTIETLYPDLPVQLAELFDSRRSGDLVLFAADGWTFDPHFVGGHGSVLPVDMRMPMILAGPGIPAGSRLERARTVDLAPTLVEMLAPGREKLVLFDGESLLSKIK